jgi:hypothetical protein
MKENITEIESAINCPKYLLKCKFSKRKERRKKFIHKTTRYDPTIEKIMRKDTGSVWRKVNFL